MNSKIYLRAAAVLLFAVTVAAVCDDDKLAKCLKEVTVSFTNIKAEMASGKNDSREELKKSVCNLGSSLFKCASSTLKTCGKKANEQFHKVLIPYNSEPFNCNITSGGSPATPKTVCNKNLAECLKVTNVTHRNIMVRLASKTISREDVEKSVCNLAAEFVECASPSLKICGKNTSEQLDKALIPYNSEPFNCNVTSGGSPVTVAAVCDNDKLDKCLKEVNVSFTKIKAKMASGNNDSREELKKSVCNLGSSLFKCASSTLKTCGKKANEQFHKVLIPYKSEPFNCNVTSGGSPATLKTVCDKNLAECLKVTNVTHRNIMVRLASKTISREDVEKSVCNLAAEFVECASPSLKICGKNTSEQLDKALIPYNSEPFNCNVTSGGPPATPKSVCDQKMAECFKVTNATFKNIMARIAAKTISRDDVKESVCNLGSSFVECVSPVMNKCGKKMNDQLDNALKPYNEDPFNCNIKRIKAGSISVLASTITISIAAVFAMKFY